MYAAGSISLLLPQIIETPLDSVSDLSQDLTMLHFTDDLQFPLSFRA
jgi:hypothetical protein